MVTLGFFTLLRVFLAHCEDLEVYFEVHQQKMVCCLQFSAVKLQHCFVLRKLRLVFSSSDTSLF